MIKLFRGGSNELKLNGNVFQCERKKNVHDDAGSHIYVYWEWPTECFNTKPIFSAEVYMWLLTDRTIRVWAHFTPLTPIARVANNQLQPTRTQTDTPTVKDTMHRHVFRVEKAVTIKRSCSWSMFDVARLKILQFSFALRRSQCIINILVRGTRGRKWSFMSVCVSVWHFHILQLSHVSKL